MSTGEPAGGQDPWRTEQERTGWYGWIAFAGIMLIVLGLFHLILGIVTVFAGFALTRGATWARIVAVVVAVVSALTNVAFMSAYPIWSVIMIAINILVIFAVTAHGDRDSLEGY